MELRSVTGNSREISAFFDTPCTGRFIGPGGKVLSESYDTEFRYELTGESYVRFEAKGEDGELFLQQIYRYV